MVAVAAFVVLVTPAFASNSPHVVNNNHATVVNNVDTYANTGANTSNGGWASNRIRGSHNNNNDAVGSDGGLVVTGNATAGTLVGNAVNSNLTAVNANDCGCGRNVAVRNHNRAYVVNKVTTEANTGNNGTNGGNANNKVGGGWWYHNGNHNNNNNNDSKGGYAGEINSGSAASHTAVVNVVNSNLTRVRR